MKKILYTAAFACGMAFCTSCVDLNQEPLSFITEDQYWENVDEEALDQTVSALYSDMWFQNYGFNSRLQRINVCADDITYREAKANNPLAYYYRLQPNIIDNTDDFSITWELFYKVINNSNKIINNVKLPEDEEKAVKFKEILGEAYFLRGLSYFYLVRMYGEIPLILKEEDGSISMPKSSVEDIYTKAIIPSLETAGTFLPVKSRTKSSANPTRWAAKACLADVYMTMAGWPLKQTEHYADAASLAKEIIDNAGNAGLYLTQEYSDLWMEAKKTQTNEHMFALHHDAKQGKASNYGKSYYPADFAPNAGWADYYANEDFFLRYPEDKRKEHNFMTEWNVKTGQKDENNKDILKKINYKESGDKLPAISKYYNYDEGAAGKSAQANGITCIYRYADVLLMYAEASVRATGSVDQAAQNALWDVQKRAQGYPESPVLTTTTDAEEFLKVVSDERGWEFFAEMKRWFELVRLEKVGEVRGNEVWGNSLFNANSHYYFPIPYQQIDLTGWDNNKGY